MRARKTPPAQSSSRRNLPKSRKLRTPRPVLSPAPNPAAAPEPPDFTRLLTVPEAAQVLHCSVRTISYMIQRGAIAPLRYGDLVRFRYSDLINAGIREGRRG